VSRSAAERTQADCPSSNQITPRPPPSNVWDCPLCPEAQRSGHWRTVPLRFKPPPQPATSDQEPATSGTVPCVPERSAVDTGGLSLFESNHPPTSDQRPTVPCVPERSGVETGGLSLLDSNRPPDQRLATKDQRRPGLSPVSRSEAEWKLADCPSSTQITPPDQRGSCQRR